jgi:hypothetical protein
LRLKKCIEFCTKTDEYSKCLNRKMNGLTLCKKN